MNFKKIGCFVFQLLRTGIDLYASFVHKLYFLNSVRYFDFVPVLPSLIELLCDVVSIVLGWAQAGDRGHEKIG